MPTSSDASPSGASSGPGRAALLATASGFAVMSLELAAVRLFAPYFGDSSYVWTNVIGVLLVALACGAWLGGRLAERPDTNRVLAMLLGVAGAWCAVVPLVSGTLGSALLADDLALDQAMGALIWGSLAATLIAFAPPVLLAGALGPLLVKQLVEAGARVGRGAGLVSATSTVGSLLGTFATTHLLIPEFGSRATIWISAGLLAACAVLCRRRGVAPVALALVALLPWWGGATVRPLAAAPDMAELLAEVESSYQFLQVVETKGGNGVPATRELKINEGLDSFHSVRIDGTPFTGGRYYDYFVSAPALAGAARDEPVALLSLGAAAGTFERVLGAVYPQLQTDSVEIDPAVVRLGREYFDAFAGNGRVFAGLDARVFVERAPRRYDVVIADCYERQIYIPAHVASDGFFRAVHEVLEDGGVVAVNVGGRRFDDPVLTAVAGTMAGVFGTAHAFRVPLSRNFLVVARRGREPVDRSALGELTGADVPGLEAIVTALEQPAAWREFGPVARPLDDDSAWLDTLQERSLARQLLNPSPWPTGRGAVEPSRAEAAAFDAYTSADFEAVEEFVAASTRATRYLRFLAGDARWRLHDLPGALAEYRAAASLDERPDLAAALEQRTALAESELQRLRDAVAVAMRNRWISWAAMAVFLAAVLGFARALGGGRPDPVGAALSADVE